MKKDKLLKLVGDPRFISGIFNYCDRWCERCYLTERCSLFAEEEEENKLNPESSDPDNEKFWQRISDSFKTAMEMLQDAAGEMGVDLDKIPDNSKEYKEERQRINNHKLTKFAVQYRNDVHHWLEDFQTQFLENPDDLLSYLQLGILKQEPDEIRLRIEEALEVISFYYFQMEVKLKRALSGLFDKYDIDPPEGFPLDKDGSAKVALIGMDRSIGACEELRRYFPVKSEEILDFLIHLDKLIKMTEHYFPDARTCIRPGFDTVNS